MSSTTWNDIGLTIITSLSVSLSLGFTHISIRSRHVIVWFAITDLIVRLIASARFQVSIELRSLDLPHNSIDKSSSASTYERIQYFTTITVVIVLRTIEPSQQLHMTKSPVTQIYNNVWSN